MKERLSKWCHNRKEKKKKDNNSGERRQKDQTKTPDIAQMLKKKSDASTRKSGGQSDSNESLPDTIIVSPDQLDNEKTNNSPSKLPLDDGNQPPVFADYSNSEEENQSQDLFTQQVKSKDSND